MRSTRTHATLGGRRRKRATRQENARAGDLKKREALWTFCRGGRREGCVRGHCMPERRDRRGGCLNDRTVRDHPSRGERR